MREMTRPDPTDVFQFHFACGNDHVRAGHSGLQRGIDPTKQIGSVAAGFKEISQVAARLEFGKAHYADVWHRAAQSPQNHRRMLRTRRIVVLDNADALLAFEVLRQLRLPFAGPAGLQVATKP
jgi:hypothetical protein